MKKCINFNEEQERDLIRALKEYQPGQAIPTDWAIRVFTLELQLRQLKYEIGLLKRS